MEEVGVEVRAEEVDHDKIDVWKKKAGRRGGM